jgi:hypothetical protein
LGYETYWFHDHDYPANFDFSNCLFISEGYAEKNIPLNNTSVYFIHIAVNPEKYLSRGCRLIDIRFNVSEINDCNYSYNMDKTKLIKIDSCSFYDPKASDNVLSEQFKRGIKDYEALYLSWATDLLPNEFNYADAHYPRERIVYWIGSIAESNIKEIQKFCNSLKLHNIGFSHNDPWRNPLSWEDAKKQVQRSYIAPDIRGSAMRAMINGKLDTGSNHKLIGYIPCRIFKNISYGQLGITNSKAVNELFDGRVLYSNNEEELLELSMPHLTNYKMITDQMNFVKQNHTYLNRACSILQVYNKEIK